MARSLRVSPEYIDQVNTALQRHGYPSQQSLANAVKISLSTVASFLNGIPIDSESFIKLSNRLGLDWREIAYEASENTPTQSSRLIRLKKQQNGLQQAWDTQHEKVCRIGNDLIIETVTENKFKLEKQLKEEKTKLTNLEAELEQIEKEIESTLPTKIPEQTIQISLLETQLKKQEASPFITGTPITRPRDFFGREKELKRLFNLLKRHPLQNAAIIGKKRSGKTSLLHYLKNITTTPTEQLRPGQKSDWLPHPETYKWVFVDLQDARMQSREGLLKHILESLNFKVPAPCDLDHFMDGVSENLSSPTVILLDEIGVGLQRCPELDDSFWESLRSLATNHTRGNLAFILSTPESPIDLAHNTGHSSPFFNIFGYTAFLGALTEAEAQELIASSPIPFADEDVKWILACSQCQPLLLQILCRERLFSLEEGENDYSWRDEGLIQIKPFADLLDEKSQGKNESTSN
ncbi:ATP-binding protein [Aliinostoc sp. HNIBRCY26]|uniref:ATP-binding protein n=1 Tax=Aliinostoc sp. HNIBRCY26 TaxID=3418997 RepID=UPI003D0518A6